MDTNTSQVAVKTDFGLLLSCNKTYITAQSFKCHKWINSVFYRKKPSNNKMTPYHPAVPPSLTDPGERNVP